MSVSIEKYLKKYPIRFLTDVEGESFTDRKKYRFKRGTAFMYLREENLPPNWYHIVTPDKKNTYRVPFASAIDRDWTFKQMSKAEKEEYNGNLKNEEDTNKKEAERLKKEEAEAERKRRIENGEEKDNTFWYWLGAGLIGFAAFQQENTPIQVVLGGVSAFCVFKALDKPIPKIPIKLPKPNMPQLTSWATLKIGKVTVVKWIAPYKVPPTKDNGFRGVTNLGFANGKAGVYCIKKNNQLIYVGQGNNVYKACLRHFEAYPIPKNDNKRDYFSDYSQNDYKVRIILTGTHEKAKRLEWMIKRKHQPQDCLDNPNPHEQAESKALKDWDDFLYGQQDPVPAYRLNDYVPF